MQADSIKIECEEDGMWMVVQLDHEIPLVTNEGVLRFRIQDIAEALYDTVKREIGPWLYERDQARASRPFTFAHAPEGESGYDLSDPKHENYHSVHADIWDAREEK